MEKEPKDLPIDKKLTILFECIQSWVRLEFITEKEALEVYAEAGVSLYSE